MKTLLSVLTAAALGSLVSALSRPLLGADPTVDTTERFAYSANTGWVNGRWDTSSPGKGATIGCYFCSGFIYDANCGWIDIGDGAPGDGIAYSQAGQDYGVNHDGLGNLTGMAYSANTGWIKFDWIAPGNPNLPKVELTTGRMSGYAYSANCGWIDLGTAPIVLVRTNSLDDGPDTDADSIADAWELSRVAAAGMSTGTLPGDLALLSDGADFDGDGQNDDEEYRADKDPFDSTSLFEIVSGSLSDAPVNNVTLEWTSSPRRVYDIMSNSDLGMFTDVLSDISPSDGATTGQVFTDSVTTERFWQVVSKKPLSP